MKPTASMPTAAESNIRTILVVDDDKECADVLVGLLVALGWIAEAVYSGRRALVFLENHLVDLVFLDIDMPQMDGYELVRILKSHDQFFSTPIVAVTGHKLENDKIKAIQAGFTAHISKPICSRDLREILTGDIGG
jgi:CheY-like chemotaxis protein